MKHLTCRDCTHWNITSLYVDPHSKMSLGFEEPADCENAFHGRACESISLYSFWKRFETIRNNGRITGN